MTSVPMMFDQHTPEARGGGPSTPRRLTWRIATLAALGAPLGLLAVPHRAWAWGRTGHAVVADVAEARLTPAVAAEVRRLLAVEGAHHLADVASWADKAKKEGLPGSPSHTIRLPIDGGAPGPHPCPGGFCADSALRVYSAVLADPGRPDTEREVALKYVVHLIGDLQQPLHDTDATGQMPVIFNGRGMTLHAVWDDGIIDAHGGRAARIAAELMQEDRGAPSDGGPMDWAREGLSLAQHTIYRDVPLHPTSTVTLPADYAATQWPVVERQLAAGGRRLARVLNDLLHGFGRVSTR